MRVLASLAVAVLVLSAAPANAQTIGTFSWQLAPFGSVLSLTITQRGANFEIQGFEAQCDNLSLPVTGLAVPQANGTIFLGLTSINENGNGLHTRAYVTLANLNGTWSDNTGNFNQPFTFNPGSTCPGGPRPGPISGYAPAAAGSDGLLTELAALRARVAALESQKK